MNLSNVLNPFTRNERNISQMMQAIQITHTHTPKTHIAIYVFFRGARYNFDMITSHVHASMMQHHIIQAVDLLVLKHRHTHTHSDLQTDM